MPIDNIGLTSKQAQEKLARYGLNTLPEKSPPSDLKTFVGQLTNPLVYVLVGAATITLILGHLSDFFIITLAIFVNTILGFVQERKANKALFALKKLIHPEAQVIRDGKIEKVEAKFLVPGDIVMLSQGDKVPADGKFVYTNRLFISEAILTGESVAVEKKESDLVYMGTVVTAGQGKMLVEITGKETEIGKIALDVQIPNENTPLKKQLTIFSKQLSLLVLSLVTFVFLAGIISGKYLFEMFTTSVALAVSAIPEGLLVGLTAVLAIGMQKILKHKGLVRKLVSAETLGGVTTICIDKTGTLTQGKMGVVNFLGDKEKLALQSVLANDMDDPLVIAAWEWAQQNTDESGESIMKKYKRLDSIPFDSKERYFACLNKWEDGKNIIFINGAPEYLLKWSSVGNKEKNRINSEISKFTKEGKRVIGFATKIVENTRTVIDTAGVKGDLNWVGLLAFTDPLREGVRDALDNTKKAGIKLIVITGDYAETAITIMKEAGVYLNDDEIILGNEVEKLTKDALAEKISASGIKLFARTTPEQKLKIVEALKSNGEVVAMMGDGVNDAPALNRADIGIVVGSATEVAKESADLVLLDSSFATIVSTIEEGRGIFDNTRKIILYLISDSFQEIVAVVGTIILGLPLPVSAAQILWINLVSDGLPNLALTVDPKEKYIMNKPPRAPKEKLVANWMKTLILLVSLTAGIISLILFNWFYGSENLLIARSMAFATLGVNSLIYVFSIRTLKEPFWKVNPLANKWLNLAVLAGLILHILPFVVPSLREFFEITNLSINNWILVFIASGAVFVVIEIFKSLLRSKLLPEEIKT